MTKLSRLIERWLDNQDSLEGDCSTLLGLCEILGYRDLDEFLSDNPGVQEAIVEWIGMVNSPEWITKLKLELLEEDV